MEPEVPFRRFFPQTLTLSFPHILMPTYISLLRGINVSGQKTIPMEELRAAYGAAGFQDVRTYVQSGNVVFSADDKKADSVRATIQSAIKRTFGFEVPVVVRTLAELRKVIATVPLTKAQLADAARAHVTFLDSKPTPQSLKSLLHLPSKPPDLFIIKGREIYLHTPNGYGRTLLNNTFFEKRLKVNATTRNWRTVLELQKLGAEVEE
jgi:uncharacterized protein (DUF1697 family)